MKVDCHILIARLSLFFACEQEISQHNLVMYSH